MERSSQGQDFYISSMEKSAKEKTRVFPFVREGIIVDMGAGAGPVTELLTQKFPQSRIVAVDYDDDMIARLQGRFQNNPRVKIVKADARDFSFPEPVNTLLFVSVLHEIFSFTNYSHQTVINTLKNAYHFLAPSGRLIIRDGVQPEQENLYLKPKHQEAYNRFFRFVQDFKVRPMVFNLGTFQQDSFVQQPAKDFAEFVKGSFYIEMHSQDVSELLSKYFYPEVNWVAELKEQFGIWTLREYQHVLIELGFHIVYSETYVLPYLLENHYTQDFEVYKLENGQLIRSSYPPSTMILVVEK